MFGFLFTLIQSNPTQSNLIKLIYTTVHKDLLYDAMLHAEATRTDVMDSALNQLPFNQ